MMKQLHTETLKIGTAIAERIGGILPTFPIVAEKGTPYPFAVFRRVSINPKDTKDNYNYDEKINMEIVVLAVKYIESVELAQKVKDAMENYRGLCQGAKINDIVMVNASEDWGADAFIQRMNFVIDIDGEYYSVARQNK